MSEVSCELELYFLRGDSLLYMRRVVEGSNYKFLACWSNNAQLSLAVGRPDYFWTTIQKAQSRAHGQVIALR